MKVLKYNSEIHKKVQKIFDLMDDLGINIEYLAGEFRITDVTKGGVKSATNLALIDAENGTPIQELAPCIEYRLKIFNS